MDNGNYCSIGRFYALFASLVIILCSFHIKGMWVINDLSIILWMFWLGVLLGINIKAPKWLRCSAFIIGIGLVACTAIPALEISFPRINWFVLGYGLLGLSVPKEDQTGTMSLKDSCFLSVLFGLIYCTCVFLSQRTGIAVYECPGDLTEHIHDWVYSLTLVPLLGLIYCFLQFSSNEKIKRLMSSKVIKWECMIVCAVAFIICIARCFLTSLRGYYLFQLALCPMVLIIIDFIAGKIKPKRTNKQNNA